MPDCAKSPYNSAGKSYTNSNRFRLHFVGSELRQAGEERRVTDAKYRIERDSMGELQVPPSWLSGAAQTQRAVENFPISGRPMPRAFIRALGLIKWAAAGANAELGLLDEWPRPSPSRPPHSRSQPAARCAVPHRRLPDRLRHQFQHECQRGHCAAGHAARARVHPNDDVNMGQSSNDVIPTAIHVSAALLWREELLPALTHLRKVALRRRRNRWRGEDRPHASDGCDAGADGPGTGRLGAADRKRRSAPQGLPAASARWPRAAQR
jgi:hypothetical protein